MWFSAEACLPPSALSQSAQIRKLSRASQQWDGVGECVRNMSAGGTRQASRARGGHKRTGSDREVGTDGACEPSRDHGVDCGSPESPRGPDSPPRMGELIACRNVGAPPAATEKAMPYTCAHGTLSELGRMACERDGGTVRRQGPGGASIVRVEAVDPSMACGWAGADLVR